MFSKFKLGRLVPSLDLELNSPKTFNPFNEWKRHRTEELDILSLIIYPEPRIPRTNFLRSLIYTSRLMSRTMSDWWFLQPIVIVKITLESYNQGRWGVSWISLKQISSLHNIYFIQSLILLLDRRKRFIYYITKTMTFTPLLS